jgi:hypothetical protein
MAFVHRVAVHPSSPFVKEAIDQVKEKNECSFTSRVSVAEEDFRRMEF